MKKQIVTTLLILCMIIGILPNITIGAVVPEKVMLTMKVGESKKLEYSDGGTFVSTNQSIALVSQSGTVEAKKAGTAGIYVYKNGAMVAWWEIKVDSEKPKVENPVVNKEKFPFVPSEKNMTNGPIKSGWKYLISYDNGKFRIKSDGTVVPSMRYNNPFYVEHLGKSYYYIRTVDGKYLSYKGEKPYFDEKKMKGNQLTVRDTPYKWYVYPENDAGVLKFSFATNEDHELFIGAFDTCGYNADSYLEIVKRLKSWNVTKMQMFEAVDADSQSIPEWWYIYKGEEVKTDKDGYDYYGKQAFENETKLPVTTTGVNYNVEIPKFNRDFPKWGTTVKTQLLSRNERGTYMVANIDDQYVNIIKYSSSGEVLGTKPIEIEKELPMFGAIFSGEKYNYIAFGQKNSAESNSKESIRIVKYDKEFNRISHISVSGSQTRAVEPFYHTGRFEENGNQLVLHTSRLRYKSSDGLNHQSNLDVFLNIDTMKVSYVSPDFPGNHVSHSFDTFVRFDDGTPVFLDLGDAYPRSVVLQKGSMSSYKKATMFKIAGPSGANYTGVTVGGIEVSSNNYLSAIATINQADAKWGKGNSNHASNGAMVPINESSLTGRDIVISVLPRNFEDGATAQNIIMGKYIGTSKIASTPQLLKVTNDKFAILWAEFSLNGGNYDEDNEQIPESYIVQYIDGNGNKLGKTKSYKKVDDFYKEFLNQCEGKPYATKGNENAENSTTTIKNGWYNLRAMNNYLNVDNSGNAELRKLSTNQAYYVENKGDGQVTLKTKDGKYLGVSEDIKNGTRVKVVGSPYLWIAYSENNKDIFSLRPTTAKKMVLNAEGEKNVDGTKIILWTHENLDAPNHAEFRFIPIDAL